MSSIASQCPYAGGKSVYRARVLLNLINDNIQYNDAQVCLQSGIYRGSKHELYDEILIVPNPANDKIKIILSEKSEGVCEISLIDILGRVIKSDSFNCSELKKELDIDDIQQGVYFVRVRINSYYKKSIKLIIAR